MKVLVTGGTGFVGSHVARNLVACGHEVRLLVRDLAKGQALFASESSSVIECVIGDITKPDTVQAALQGCDAVVHAAAGTPIQTKNREEMFAVNVGGVRNVVDGALALGFQRIVCLSSVTAIFNTEGARVTADAPPTPSRHPYGQSKVEAEYYLRELQAQGKPISIVYPGGIIGPDDPGFSDTCKALKHRIENGFRLFDAGGMQHVDVRDLANFVVSLCNDGSGGRYVLPGVYLQWGELADIIESVSGAQLRRIPAQGWKLRLVGRGLDLVRHFKPVDSPVSAETMRYATQWPNIANTQELALRGLSLRDPSDTFRDTLAWMVQDGHLAEAQCPAFKQEQSGSHG